LGNTVDFKNTIIIMTTNAGAETISSSNVFGFDRGRDDAANYEAMTRILVYGLLGQRSKFIVPTPIATACASIVLTANQPSQFGLTTAGARNLSLISVGIAVDAPDCLL